MEQNLNLLAEKSAFPHGKSVIETQFVTANSSERTDRRPDTGAVECLEAVKNL